MDRAALLTSLRARAFDLHKRFDAPIASSKLPPPLEEAALRAVEAQLGFPVPSLLREVYTTIANGGFGPGYGLIGLTGGALDDLERDVVRAYRDNRQPDEDDAHWAWPEKLLPLVHLGCGMYMCVDCRTDEGSMIWFEPNPHARGEPWTDAFFPVTDSLHAWFEMWLDGVDPLAKLLGGGAS